MNETSTPPRTGERNMPRQDTVDFLAAFAVGTVLGIGATLLLQPQRTAKERVVRQLKPYRKQMRRSYSQARSAVREGADATADLSGEAIAAGRDLLGDFRDEVAKVLEDARSEIRSMTGAEPPSLADQLAGQLRKTGRRFGR
ncbi:MAG: hypothetical protein M3409_08315 [Gemmatimonadota bacterium]|nr:hypothetical protein [Gemmatimonadota bacterium]